MPTMPKMEKLPTDGAKLLNSIRKDGSEWYQSMVPRADGTTANLREIGNIIVSFEAAQNEFLSALVNRIGRSIITSRLYENPWSMFKKGLLELGETVEEIFVNLCNPHDYDPEVAAEQQWKREIPDVRAAFHTMNYQKFYKETINNAQLRQAFLAWSGILDLVGRIIDSMYSSANFDEFVTMKYMIARMALRGYMHPVSVPNMTKENAHDIVTIMKGVSTNLTFQSGEYNYSGVETYTNKTDQFLIMNAMFDATVDVNVLASAFNIEKATFMGNRVLVNTFTMTESETKRLNKLFALDSWYVPFTAEENAKLETIAGFLVDRDWFMIYDNLYDMTQKYNGESMEWNYWYHVWKTFSASPFMNALVLATGAQAVTGVTVTPATASLTKGATLQMSAVVAGTGFIPQGVTWYISGQVSANTIITGSGLLMIAADETGTSITVTATSVFDSGKSGTATITITAGGGTGII